MDADNKELIGLDDIKSFDDESSDDFEIAPQNMDNDTFKLRTDPSPLLEQLRSDLTMKVKKYHKSGKHTDPQNNKKYDWVQKEGTKPLCNQIGVEQILSITRKLVNNHTVQGNTKHDGHKEKMRVISDDLTRTFWTKRKLWDMELKDVNDILGGLINMIDLFLSRTINNEERVRYGETFKDSTTRSVDGKRGSNSAFSKIYDFLKR